MNPWNKNLHGKEYLNHYKDKKIWNTGLTKETDERVKKQSEKIVGHKVLEETKEKILKTKKERYPNGISWNKGLTKETDERVKKQSEKIVGHNVLEETKEKISKSLKGKMSGDKNPSWKGGIIKDCGYIWVKDKYKIGLARNKGYAKRCNVVWYEKTGEIIDYPYFLHHKNLNKLDDRFNNLKKVTRATHINEHKKK
jgi:hypothetical protein